MKKAYLYTFILVALLSFEIACTKPNDSKATTEETIIDSTELAQGFQLLESGCFACHSPAGNHDDRVAPPMIAVKKHYIDEQTSKEEFTKDLVTFVLDPNEEHSKMPGALKKFGLMPKLNFNEEQLGLIAQYIYETEIEAPEWFEQHYKEERKKNRGADKNLSPIKRGLNYVMATKSVLGKNLLGTIKAEGADKAVEFCNLNAINLTDSMSKTQNVHINRMSDQPRNPNNLAKEPFLSKILEYKGQLKEGKELKGGSLLYNEKEYTYFPIVTNKMCLQCHGNKTQINKKTLAKINSLYPEDKAKNYKENELRGIWTVEIP